MGTHKLHREERRSSSSHQQAWERQWENISPALGRSPPSSHALILEAAGAAIHPPRFTTHLATSHVRAVQLARRLQRRQGNVAVGRMVKVARLKAPIVQAKLLVTPPGDRYEQEADRAAAGAVQNMHAVGPDSAQRAALSPVGPSAGVPVTPAVEASIHTARSGGQPLQAGMRGQLEGALGADFAGVRVHTGAQAHALNEALQARAFTTGHDIFFRQGEYQPGSSVGQGLMAHELAHVMQQGLGLAETSAPMVQRWPLKVYLGWKKVEATFPTSEVFELYINLREQKGEEHLIQIIIDALEAENYEGVDAQERLNLIDRARAKLQKAHATDPTRAQEPAAAASSSAPLRPPAPASHSSPISTRAPQRGQAGKVAGVKMIGKDELRLVGFSNANDTLGQVNGEQLWDFIMQVRYLIHNRDYDGAYQRCISSENEKLLGCDLVFWPVTDDGTNDDILSRIAKNSIYTPGTNKIQIAVLPDKTKPSSMPDIARKIALVYLEEYMHLYQGLTKHFFAGETGQFMKLKGWNRKGLGFDLDEVDILAAFHNWGFIDLNDNFVDRYPERKMFRDWLMLHRH
jgi:hypothetical protein